MIGTRYEIDNLKHTRKKITNKRKSTPDFMWFVCPTSAYIHMASLIWNSL